MPDHPAIQESLGRIMLELEVESPQSAAMERARKLLSLAAYAGHKTAIRHLATTSTVINWEELSGEDPLGSQPGSLISGNLFTHLGLDQDEDPFYQLMMRFHQFKDDQTDLQSMIDAIRKTEMPLNVAVVHVIAVVLGAMEIMAKELPIDFRAQFMELYTYIEPHLQVKRTLPKHRDPFRIYAEEFKFPVDQIFASAAQVYQSLSSGN